MMHAIISDTHSPRTINKALNHLKELIVRHPDLDSVIINGDLLGIFSMDKSSIHRQNSITSEDLDNYLKEAAPKFYKKYKDVDLTEKNTIEYIDERYDEIINTLKSFSKIKKTIFNLGNHESKHHFLVFQELEFLLNKTIPRIPENKLETSFKLFESKLKELEKTNDFKHISHEHILDNGTLILGIPGMTHGTEGNDSKSILQEQHTRNLINNAIKDLEKVHSIIIYNHTQGNYNRENGSYAPASKSLNQFLKNLPSNIKQRVFVQSHNHWAHTQFIYSNDTHFILNNAGLHDGIFNMISFNSLGVDCFDVDPNTKETIKLKLSTEQKIVESDLELISRFYPNPEMILARKNVKEASSLKTGVKNSTSKIQPKEEKQIQNQELKQALNPQKVDELKKKIFG